VVGFRLRPLGVPLHDRRVRDAELPRHEVQHLARHVERILQERPEPAHGHQLEREASLHVVPAPQVHQLPVLVIEEEHPLQVRLRRRPRVPAVRRPSSSVRNSTGIDRTLGANQAVLTCSDQTVTRSCVDWPTHIGTTPGGNAPGFSSLSPVAVPLWADPRSAAWTAAATSCAVSAPMTMFRRSRTRRTTCPACGRRLAVPFQGEQR
jgi:hypothetical protein